MFRRRRIGYVALLGAAVVAVFLWRGEDANDRRGRSGSQTDAADAATDAQRAELLRNARRRDAGTGTSADSSTSDVPAADFSAAEDAFAGTDSAEAEDEGEDSLGAAAVAPIALDPLRGERLAASVSLQGFDPLAPRELLAWRLSDGRFAIAARGSSDRDGSLHFPDLVAARDGLEIVVTAVDGAPGLPGASDPRRWAARDPVAPYVRLLAGDEGGNRVRIAPREGSGTVVLADAYGVVLARYPVAPSPIDATREFDVSFAANETDTHLFVSHEFDDGRASDWEVLTLPAIEPAEDE